ncbi:hypothetical protein CVT26_005169 [Gymnopilus dilepis]|uniref:Aminoglycoside phosphotransferase domain-containing protein n=1 Tax=Gymnopilus dilepis TaxID=231916 RepID=A0A409WHA8_9AGAR|nr:hypothetical protein CVT26_005169 [Gymnopilus dilepis]
MHRIKHPVIPEWPLRSATILGKLWFFLPDSLRLSVYRLLRFVGAKIWPNQRPIGGHGKQRLPFNLYCKYGSRISLPEVLATSFVYENTTIPVPRILDVVYEGEDLFVLMTRLPGVPVLHVARDLDEAAWCRLEADLSDWLRQLRSLAPPSDIVGSYLQTSSLQQYIDVNRAIGPWLDIAAFHQYMITLCPEDQGNEAYQTFRRAARSRIFVKDYRLCFTHGDLAIHNLLIENGRLSGMVDFENSGWFPEYWEYATALYCKLENRWKTAIRNIFAGLYDEEIEVLHIFAEANSGNV